jgi:hypothetical protein
MLVSFLNRIFRISNPPSWAPLATPGLDAALQLVEASNNAIR